MSISIFDATVPSYLQMLNAVSGFMKKARTHFESEGTDLREIVELRLIADMQPFRFQILSVVHHSRGAIEGVRAGLFEPPNANSAAGFEDLQALVESARADLQKVTSSELEVLSGRSVTFRLGKRSMPFTVENFLLSFSLPNFYFHSTTAYDLLRAKGAPLGKLDFLGAVRLSV